jgi:YHS domain-containing protein
MLRSLFVDFVVPLLVLWILRNLFNSIFAAPRRGPVASKPIRPAPNVPAGGELKKDPVCGTYVSVNASITKRVNGETLHFCSADCRDKFRAA